MKSNEMINGSLLERMLRSGNFSCTCEIGPPKSADFDHIDKLCELLRGKIEGANLTDNQTAVVRLSSIGAAIRLLQKGVEPIVQMTCRDRNRIAIQSDLLAAWALGVKNVLCLSGDHQSFGNHPHAKSVYDVDSVQLISILARLRDEGRFECGEECKVCPKFFIGCAENPFGDPFEFRAVRLEKKINAGANFVQTQCIMDMERFELFMEKVRERGLHKRVFITAGLMPVKSPKMARYMQKGVAGMMVSDEFCERLEKAADPKDESISLTADYARRCREIEGVSGVHVMAFNWEEVTPDVLERAGLLPRPQI